MGDILLCKKSCVMDDGIIAFIKGKSYEIFHISSNYGVQFVDEQDCDHEMGSMDLSDKVNYSEWFYTKREINLKKLLDVKTDR